MAPAELRRRFRADMGPYDHRANLFNVVLASAGFGCSGFFGHQDEFPAKLLMCTGALEKLEAGILDDGNHLILSSLGFAVSCISGRARRLQRGVAST